MENTVASQEFVILALGLLLSFIVVASIAFTPNKEDEKEEKDKIDSFVKKQFNATDIVKPPEAKVSRDLKFSVTIVPPRTDFNVTQESIAKLKELDQQGLLKRAEPYKPKTTRPRYSSNKDDSFYDVSDNIYFDNSTHQSNHECNDPHTSSSHDHGSHDCGGGWD